MRRYIRPGGRLDPDARMRTEWVFDDSAPLRTMEISMIVSQGREQGEARAEISHVTVKAQSEIATVMENAAGGGDRNGM